MLQPVQGFLRRGTVRVGLVALISLGPACARLDSVRSAQRVKPVAQTGANAPTIPQDKRDGVLTEVEGEYGKVLSVFAEDDATQADWRRAEPNNTSGLAIESQEDTKAIHFIFFTGDFFAKGPTCMACDGVQGASFDEGRAVYDDSGQILNLSLWLQRDSNPPRTTGSPAFGPEFDDA
jgi:hypothetical protein